MQATIFPMSSTVRSLTVICVICLICGSYFFVFELQLSRMLGLYRRCEIFPEKFDNRVNRLPAIFLKNDHVRTLTNLDPSPIGRRGKPAEEISCRVKGDVDVPFCMNEQHRYADFPGIIKRPACSPIFANILYWDVLQLNSRAEGRGR